jgi:hypothetical protein
VVIGQLYRPAGALPADVVCKQHAGKCTRLIVLKIPNTKRNKLHEVSILAGLLLFFCLTPWTSSMLADVYQVRSLDFS